MLNPTPIDVEEDDPLCPVCDRMAEARNEALYTVERYRKALKDILEIARSSCAIADPPRDCTTARMDLAHALGRIHGRAELEVEWRK